MKMKNDLLIYGLDSSDIKLPFSIGGFTVYPDYNLEKYLKGYEADKVKWVLEREPKYACYEINVNSDANAGFFNFQEDYFTEVQLFITAFRLTA
jgi:hypothetical protein